MPLWTSLKEVAFFLAKVESSNASTPPLEDWEQQDAGGVPLVTVVIPCYNQAHFLGEAIESVLAQSYPNFEIVVVDDGSTDETSEVAQRYSRVRCIHQDNQGLSAARNTGIRHSRGDYLVFLDADDRLLPDALKVGLECFNAHPECAFVFGHFRKIAVDGAVLRKPKPPSDKDGHYIGLLRGPYIAVPAMGMYRRFVFETIDWFDPAVSPAADYDLYLRITRRFPVYRHGTVVAEYRQHGANMTRDSARMLKATIKTLRKQRRHAKKDKRHREAYTTGAEAWRRWYGVPLVKEVRAQVRGGEWRLAMMGVLTLLRYYPGGLALVLNERYWLTRELQAHDRQLWRPGRKIRSNSALKKPREEVQRLNNLTRV